MKQILPYLILSVTLSSARNITSKKTSEAAKEKAGFFMSQTVLFGSATLLLAIFFVNQLIDLAYQTLIFAAIYGVLLVLSQWMLTFALGIGNTSVCTVIYSLGFILPTLSGRLFFKEEFTYLGAIGVVLAVIVVLLNVKKEDKNQPKSNRFLPLILVAMLSSGGLGIMQKVQQSRPFAEQSGGFVLTAFLLAFLISLTAFLICNKRPALTLSSCLYPAVTGVCFGGANLFNTILAGKMKSAVFFPLQNISTILLTTLLGIVLFKEKITKKTALILSLGILVILLFSIKI